MIRTRFCIVKLSKSLVRSKWHPHRPGCPSTPSMVRATVHPPDTYTPLQQTSNSFLINRFEKYNRRCFHPLPLHPPATLHFYTRQLQDHHPLRPGIYRRRNRRRHVLSRPAIGMGSHGGRMGEMGGWSVFLAEYIVAILDLGCGGWRGI